MKLDSKNTRSTVNKALIALLLILIGLVSYITGVIFYYFFNK